MRRTPSRGSEVSHVVVALPRLGGIGADDILHFWSSGSTFSPSSGREARIQFSSIQIGVTGERAQGSGRSAGLQFRVTLYFQAISRIFSYSSDLCALG